MTRSRSSCRELPSFRTLPGGSAANTARGIAWLASAAGQEVLGQFTGLSADGAGRLPPVFNGAIGRDATGDQFEQLMTEAGVSTSHRAERDPYRHVGHPRDP